MIAALHSTTEISEDALEFQDRRFHLHGKLLSFSFFRARFQCPRQGAGLYWQATSRGLRTWAVGAHEGPISEFAAYRLTALDIPFDSQRFPIQLSEVDLADADLVVALKKTEHHAMMAEQFPAWADRIQYWQIDDMDCATADEALPICESRVKCLVDRLMAEQKQQEPPARLRRAA